MDSPTDGDAATAFRSLRNVQRVQAAGLRVRKGFSVQGFGFRVFGLEFGFRLQGFGECCGLPCFKKEYIEV